MELRALVDRLRDTEHGVLVAQLGQRHMIKGVPFDPDVPLDEFKHIWSEFVKVAQKEREEKKPTVWHDVQDKHHVQNYYYPVDDQADSQEYFRVRHSLLQNPQVHRIRPLATIVTEGHPKHPWVLKWQLRQEIPQTYQTREGGGQWVRLKTVWGTFNYKGYAHYRCDQVAEGNGLDEAMKGKHHHEVKIVFTQQAIPERIAEKFLAKGRQLLLPFTLGQKQDLELKVIYKHANSY